MRAVLLTYGLFGLMLVVHGQVQPPTSDLNLLAGRDFTNGQRFAQYRLAGNSTRPVTYRKQGWTSRYNPVLLLMKFSMLGYQRLLSQQLARSCPYQLTCSNFSKEAIEQYGMLKGVLLTDVTRATSNSLKNV